MPRVRGHWRMGSTWVRSHYRRPPRHADWIIAAIIVVILLLMFAATA
jgi:hypothetical protein